MFKIRVLLLQMQKNHKECLEIYFKVPAIREDVFTWLNDLESKQSEDTTSSRESINKLILNYLSKLVDMDSSQAIKLVEQWLMNPDHFCCDHIHIVDERLKNEGDLKFKYLSTFILEKENQIIEQHSLMLINGSGVNKGYTVYKELMLRFVKVLLSTLGEKRYRG